MGQHTPSRVQNKVTSQTDRINNEDVRTASETVIMTLKATLEHISREAHNRVADKNTSPTLASLAVSRISRVELVLMKMILTFGPYSRMADNIQKWAQ
jgi:hypothetical protein